MSKLKYILLTLILIIFSSCVSSGLKEIDENSSYVAVYLKDNYEIWFKELNTNKVIKVKMKKRDGLSIVKIPLGEYAIKQIRHKGGYFSNSLDLPTPLYLKSVFKLERNSVIFLGDIESRTKDGKFGLTYLYLYCNYSYEEAVQEIDTNFYVNTNFKVKPLVQLSLGNKKETHFKFR